MLVGVTNGVNHRPGRACPRALACLGFNDLYRFSCRSLRSEARLGVPGSGELHLVQLMEEIHSGLEGVAQLKHLGKAEPSKVEEFVEKL